jgi:HAD superfamily hydrolase (TIGR01509 family)
MKKTNVELLVFDLDGTLVDAFGAVTRSLNYMFSRMGYPRMTKDEVKRQVGWGEKTLVRAFVTEEDLEKSLKIYRRHHSGELRKGVKFLPGARQMLKRLKADGYQLAIASNRPSPFTRIILKELEIREFFSQVICADEVPNKKPAPDMLKVILRELEVRPSRAVYVGDMNIDIQTGRRARMRTIGIDTGSCTRDQLMSEHPTMVIGHLSEITRWLSSKNGCVSR